MQPSIFYRMRTHFEHLEGLIPDLRDRKILDIGAGEGGFLVELASRGVQAIGIEYYPVHIETALARAAQAGVTIDLRLGRGEALPFDSESFDFANMSEVLEHVDDPIKVMSELFRVLRKGGQAYVSVPARYGTYDPHYHLYGINWLPRTVAETIIDFLGKRKGSVEDEKGRQKLSDMHYYTYRAFQKMLIECGFEVRDIRAIRIRKIIPRYLHWPALFVYFMCRNFYFDSFHVLATRSG